MTALEVHGIPLEIQKSQKTSHSWRKYKKNRSMRKYKKNRTPGFNRSMYDDW